MSALLLAIKKIIAIITAIFIPASTAAPVIPQYARVVNVSYIDNREVIDSSEMTFEEDGEEPADEIEEYDGEHANKPMAVVEEDANDLAYARAEEIPALETWDVSATDNDDVVMAFYDTEDTETLIEQLAGKITALFTPMTAYAADGFSFGTTLSFEADDETLGANFEFGNDAEEVNNPITGTIVISGKGNMMDAIYNCLIDQDLYVKEVVRLFKAVEGLTVVPVIDGEYEDLVELDANIKWQLVNGAEEVNYVEVTEAMREQLNPQAMLKYSPREVIITKGVKNISDYAFLCCTDLEEIVINGGIKEIGRYAFAYCNNLTKVTIEEGVQRIDESAFAYCRNLDEVVLPESIQFIDSFAFEAIKDNATIKCPNDFVRAMFAEHDIAPENATIA